MYDIALIIAILVALVAAIWHVWFNSIRGHCRLLLKDDQEFKRYYALKSSLFDSITAGKMSCENFYTAHLPYQRMKDNSFIVYGEKGSGKSTLIHCVAMGNPTANSRFMVLLEQKELETAFLHFTRHILKENQMSVTMNIQDAQKQISAAIAKHWKPTDFIQLVLVLTVKSLVQRFDTIGSVVQKLDDVRKLQLLDIFCLYLPEDSRNYLAETIAKFIRKQGTFSTSDFELVNVATEDGFDNTVHFSAVRVREKVQGVQTFLQSIYNHRKLGRSSTLPLGDTILHLKILSELLQSAKKTLSIVIDGLDELSGIFRDDPSAGAALNNFVISSMSHQLQLMMNDGRIFWYYSFPAEELQLSSVLTDARLRTDRIPVIHIHYTPELLIGYADNLLDKMRAQQSALTRCTVLPRFREFVNYENDQAVRQIVDKLRHPRDMNHFMTFLFLELNTNAERNKFICTLKDVTNAYNQLSRIAHF